jgi:serine/threonine protein kinase
MTAFSTGDMIADRFLVLEHRAGGFSDVYLTFDLHPVEHACRALKTIRSAEKWSREARAAFDRETAAWISLGKHTNVVRCFTAMEIANVPYLILEWISDEISETYNLRNLIGNTALGSHYCPNAIADLCRALIHCKQLLPGFAHGDIKPENLLIGENLQVKLTDFGLTRTRALFGNPAGVEAADWIGTPQYMAPELWGGTSPTELTDIYAIGCLIYEMIEGEWPFPGRSVPSIRRGHIEGGLQSPTLMTKDVWQVVSLCLSKDPKDRPQSYEDLADLVRAAFRDRTEPARDRPVKANTMTATDYGNQALGLMNAGEDELALKSLDRALELDPTLSRAYNNRALLYCRLNRPDDAMRDWARALELDPDFVEALNNRAGKYNEIGKVELALADAERAVQLSPEWATAQTTLARLLLEADRLEEALQHADKAVSLLPNHVPGRDVRGTIYLTVQRYAEAERDFSAILSFDDVDPPTGLRAHIMRIKCLGRMGLTQVGEAELERQIHDVRVALLLGRLFLEFDEPIFALKCLVIAHSHGAGEVDEMMKMAIKGLYDMPADDPRLRKFGAYLDWSDDPESMINLLAERLGGQLTPAELGPALDAVVSADPMGALDQWPILNDPGFYDAFKEVVLPRINTLAGRMMILQSAILESMSRERTEAAKGDVES